MPHNVIVQFLVEWGVLGTALFSSMYLYALHRGISKLRSLDSLEIPGVCAAIIVAALSVHGLTDGTFYHGKASFYLALCLAIWLGTRTSNSAAGVTNNVT